MKYVVLTSLCLLACKTERVEFAPVVTVDASHAAPAPIAAVALSARARAQAEQALDENCQMCHSLDLVKAQRLGAATWEKEVKKMIGWGAPLPPESIKSLVALLSEELGVDAPLAPPEEIDATAVLAQVAPQPTSSRGNAQRGAIAYANACASCHGRNGAGGDVAPALVGRPTLYREQEFTEIVRGGRRRMPASPLDAHEISDVIAFLRTLGPIRAN